MFKASAYVVTASGGRYMNRLCKHWSHKFQVTSTETDGEVLFGSDRLAMVASAEGLTLTLECAEEASLQRFEPVVAEHLQRMANAEPLTITWTH